MGFHRMEVVAHAEVLHLVGQDFAEYMVLLRVAGERYQIRVTTVLQEVVSKEHIVAVVASMVTALDMGHFASLVLVWTVVLDYMVVVHRDLAAHRVVSTRTQQIVATDSSLAD